MFYIIFLKLFAVKVAVYFCFFFKRRVDEEIINKHFTVKCYVTDIAAILPKNDI